MFNQKSVLSMTLWLVAASQPALAVRNGLDASGDQHKSIFLLRSRVGPGTESNCTAWAYKYKRCLVTAAHCLDNTTKLSIASGGSPLTDAENVKVTNIRAAAPHIPYDGTWNDVAVLFADLIKGQTDEKDAKLLKQNDFLPLKVGQDLGLRSVADASLPKDLLASPGAPKQAQIIGYGNNGSNLDVNPPQNIGSNVKRKGSPLVSSYVKGSSQTVPRSGSYYSVIPKAGDGDPTRIACKVDSGGPLLVDGKSYGVASIGVTEDGSGLCSSTTATLFTALDNSKVGNDKSNFDWMNDAAEHLCGKAVHAAPKDAKTGRVDGTIQGGGATPVPGDAQLNDRIACSDTSYDCDEMIHDDESVTLTATAKTNYAFDKWTDGAGNQSALCPCSLLNPTNPTCNFSYESVGFYPPVGDPDNLQNMGSSSEVAYCQANFKFSRPYPTGNQMSPTP